MREHLGLLHCDSPHDYTENSKPLPAGNVYDWGSEDDLFVQDPLSPPLWKLIGERATVNTSVFKEVFHSLPDDDGKSIFGFY